MSPDSLHMSAYSETHFWESDPFCTPGWFCFPKKNEVHQWPESRRGSPVKTKVNIRQEGTRRYCRDSFTINLCPFLYLGGVEWSLLCTQHCHRSCCWSWNQGALEEHGNSFKMKTQETDSSRASDTERKNNQSCHREFLPLTKNEQDVILKRTKLPLTHFCSNHGWRWGSLLMELLPFSLTLGGKLLRDGKW